MFRLGELNEFADGASRAIQIPLLEKSIHGLVVRQGNRLHAYINRCPHTGAPLNWTEHQFLTRDGSWIQCSLHGALFDIATGHCHAGPCAGDQLRRLALEERDGVWYADVADLVSEIDGSQ